MIRIERMLSALLLCLLLAALFAFPAFAEEFSDAPDALPAELEAYLSIAWPGCTLESVSSGDTAAAAILTRGGESRLAVFEKKADGWYTEIENAAALYHAGEGSFSLLLQQDEDGCTLTLMYTSSTPENPNLGSWQEYFSRTDEGWLMNARLDSYSDEFGLVWEDQGGVRDGMLWHVSEQYIPDASVLRHRECAPLPYVFPADSLLLKDLNNLCPPITGSGYPLNETHDLPDEVLSAVFGYFAPSGYVYAGGVFENDRLLFLADKPDGSRVLLCGSFSGSADSSRLKENWHFRETSALPAGTAFGIADYSTAVIIPDGVAFTVSQFADDTWYISRIIGEETFSVGRIWAADQTPPYSTRLAAGSHSCSDLMRIPSSGWTRLPSNLQDFVTRMDCRSYAVPNTSKAGDLLNLRRKASKSAASDGKFCSGTPVELLKKSGDWYKVRVGTQEGYMMAKYLLSGSGMLNSAGCAFSMAQCRDYSCTVRWQNGKTETLLYPEMFSMAVIGSGDSKTVLLWDPERDLMGSVAAKQLTVGE